MVAPADTGIDKAELKKLLIRSKREPVHCAVAMGKDQQALIMLDKIKPPRTISKEIEKKFGEVKTPRWGSAFVDVDEDPKLVILTLNKPISGFARKLKKTLRGTGFSKVEVRLEDGTVDEAVGDEEEEEDAEGKTSGVGASGDADARADGPVEGVEGKAEQPATQGTAPLDVAGLTQRLTGLVRSMIPVIAADPSRQAELKALATQAQAGLKASDPGVVQVIDQLEASIKGGAGASPSASASPGNGSAPAAVADPAKQAALAASPQLWQDTITTVTSGIGKLKDAIRKDFADEAPEVVADIEKNLARIDQVTTRFDATLASLLQSAAAATDEAARKAELTKARAVLTEHIKYAASEPLIAMIDENPFGVSPEIRKTLVSNLTQLASVVR
jgi:hypothetical protein